MIRKAFQRHATAVQKYITEDLKKFFPTETKKITQPIIKKIRDEAQLRLKDIDKYRHLRTRYDDKNVENYTNQKRLMLYKTALVKGYSFIMKTRQYITKEKVSYLVMIDSFSQNPTMAKLQLEDLLPGINIAMSKDGALKLQLNNIDKLSNIVKNRSNKLASYIADPIINQYLLLRNIKKSPDGTKRLQGFIYEQAIKSAAMGRTVDYTTDREAFYRGGDLKRDEIPAGLAEENENIEAKNIASKKWGAQLASEGTIEMALWGIVKVCEKTLSSPKVFEETINKFIFKTDKNIGQRIQGMTAKSLEEKVSAALDKVINLK